MARGLAAAFSAANRSGGVHGRKLQLVHLDDAFRPELSEKLLDEAARDRALVGVAAVFGTLATLKISQSGILRTHGLTVAAATTGARKPRELHDPLVRFFRPTYQDEIAMIVRHASTIGIREVGFFHEDSGFGRDGVDAMDSASTTHRVTARVRHAYKATDEDFTEAARRFQASPAQAVVLFAVQNAAARFVRQLRSTGFQKPIFSISVINADLLARELGTAARGVAVAQVVPPPHSARLAISRDFQVSLAEGRIEGLSHSHSAFEGYIVGRLIVAGMRKARGPLDREAFTAALRALGEVDLGGIRAGLDEGSGHQSRYLELGVIDGAGQLRN
jgi:ABC-type branched-subunit amino acid transport system substrate-binding protein